MAEWEKHCVILQPYKRGFVEGVHGENSFSALKPLCSNPLALFLFCSWFPSWCNSMRVTACTVLDLCGHFRISMSDALKLQNQIPLHLNISWKTAIILATTQAVCTTGVVSMWEQSKAAPPGTLQFPKLSRCVFPLTAFFALRPSPKHESKPPVAVITAPLNRNDKWTNVTIPWPACSLFALTASLSHTHTPIQAPKSSLLSTRSSF